MPRSDEKGKAASICLHGPYRACVRRAGLRQRAEVRHAAGLAQSAVESESKK